jgi:hypothetical protein
MNLTMQAPISFDVWMHVIAIKQFGAIHAATSSQK